MTPAQCVIESHKDNPSVTYVLSSQLNSTQVYLKKTVAKRLKVMQKNCVEKEF